MKSIDLNCDVGETSSERDHAILPFVSSCNVSCGSHAGDSALIGSTIEEALRLGVSVGAHPSYPDRENFGRVTMHLPIDELCDQLRDQISFLSGILDSCGGKLNHIKPHGALYNDMTADAQLANAVIDLVQQVAPSAAIYGQADSHLADICRKKQVQFIHEVFGDRRYEDLTTLRARTHSDGLIDNLDDFQLHFNSLLNGTLVDIQNRKHNITVHTICIHSDTPSAIDFAKLAKKTLKENHVRMPAP